MSNPLDNDPFADDLSPEAIAEIERRMNINRLQNEAQEIAGGQMTGFSSGEAPSEIVEQFWENLVAFEKAPQVTMHQKLGEAALEMPPDAELNDARLSETLWEIIGWLADEGTVLENTDHLSDRELYVWLRDDYFQESGAEMPGMTCHASPVGSCGEDDMKIIFRFYADDAWREDWARDFPEFEMPPRGKPPYDRDRLLPNVINGIRQNEESDEFGD